MSVNASRPPSSISCSASTTTGSAARSRAPPACRVISVSACATESCRSRAILVRSASTASRANRSRLTSAATRWSVETRVIRANPQAPITIALLAIRSASTNSLPSTSYKVAAAAIALRPNTPACSVAW